MRVALEGKVPPLSWPSMFPGPLADFVLACRQTTEAHPAAIVAHLLVALGNVIGRAAHVRIAETPHYTNENLLIVGPTANGRKGESWHMAQVPFESCERDWLDRSGGGLSSGEGLIHSVRDAHVSTDDEGVRRTEDRGVDDKRLLVVEGEFANVLRQQKRDGNVLSEVIRDAWDGRPVLQRITKHAPIRATGAHVSIVGHITPSDLRTYLDLNSCSNGLLNRFWLIATHRVRVLSRPVPLPRGIRSAMAESMARAIDYGRSTGELGMTDAAYALWEIYYPSLTRGRAGVLDDVLARGAQHVLRFATILAVWERARVIDAPHVESAKAWWDYAESSAAIIFRGRTGNAAADRILAGMEVGERLSRSQVNERFFSGKLEAHRLTEALDLLEAMGAIERTKEPTQGRAVEMIRRLPAAFGRGHRAAA